MPSSDERIRRSGQMPSWTPATTTTSHSRPFARCAGQDPDEHRRPGRGPVRGGVARDLLAGHAVQEQRGRARRQPHDEPGRRVEQRAHRVQVTVGRGTTGATGGGHRLPRGCQAGRVPHRPEHVVRVAVGGCLPRQRQQTGHPAGGVRGGGTDQGQLARVAQDSGQRLRRAVLAHAPRRRPQRPAEPAQAQGVGAPERPGEQLDRRLLVEGLRVQRAAQQQEQRANPRARPQAAARRSKHDHRGHPGRGERPAQQRHLADHRSDQDRHGRPGHPVVQVRPAERVGHDRSFLAGA